MSAPANEIKSPTLNRKRRFSIIHSSHQPHEKKIRFTNSDLKTPNKFDIHDDGGDSGESNQHIHMLASVASNFLSPSKKTSSPSSHRKYHQKTPFVLQSPSFPESPQCTSLTSLTKSSTSSSSSSLSSSSPPFPKPLILRSLRSQRFSVGPDGLASQQSPVGPVSPQSKSPTPTLTPTPSSPPHPTSPSSKLTISPTSPLTSSTISPPTSPPLKPSSPKSPPLKSSISSTSPSTKPLSPSTPLLPSTSPSPQTSERVYACETSERAYACKTSERAYACKTSEKSSSPQPPTKSSPQTPPPTKSSFPLPPTFTSSPPSPPPEKTSGVVPCRSETDSIETPEQTRADVDLSVSQTLPPPPALRDLHSARHSDHRSGGTDVCKTCSVFETSSPSYSKTPSSSSSSSPPPSPPHSKTPLSSPPPPTTRPSSQVRVPCYCCQVQNKTPTVQFLYGLSCFVEKNSSEQGKPFVVRFECEENRKDLVTSNKWAISAFECPIFSDCDRLILVGPDRKMSFFRRYDSPFNEFPSSSSFDDLLHPISFSKPSSSPPSSPQPSSSPQQPQPSSSQPSPSPQPSSPQPQPLSELTSDSQSSLKPDSDS